MKKGWLALFTILIPGLAAILVASDAVQHARSTRSIAEHKRNLRGSALSHDARPLEYGNLPLSFEANQGQTDSRVKFLARGSGYTLFLTLGEAVVTFSRPSKAQTPATSQIREHSCLETNPGLTRSAVLQRRVRQARGRPGGQTRSLARFRFPEAKQ